MTDETKKESTDEVVKETVKETVNETVKEVIQLVKAECHDLRAQVAGLKKELAVLKDAAAALIEQAELGEYSDGKDHRLVDNAAYDDLKALVEKEN